MRAADLIKYLQFAISKRFPVLVTGKPGVGKSDISEDVADITEHHLITTHPVVSDPTDFKGLPFPNKDFSAAEFLPFGDLKKIIEATVPTIMFIDDLGQAPATVQAALMQLLLARRINGHKVSDFVTFIAATNGKEHKAGVSGILEPVKSRFKSIVELEVNTEDWLKWARNNNMPPELMAFITYRENLLDNFVASKDLKNSACPRTVAAVGQQQMEGLPKELYFEVFKGAAGEAFAIEYCGFLEMINKLTSITDIIKNPLTAPIPDEPSALYATCMTLAGKMDKDNIANIIQYVKRMPAEAGAACMKDATNRNAKIQNTREFTEWATKNANDTQ